MKVKWNIPGREKLLKFLGQYKFVLIVIAAGIVLLMLPGGTEQANSSSTENRMNGEESFSVEELENRLSEVLSKVDGAGRVSVVLTVQTGMERVLATDTTASQTEDERELEEQTVIISTNGGEEAVLVKQRYPTFQGALVVCEGGDDPNVRLQLTQAVAVLTGLGADRITVCKGS